MNRSLITKRKELQAVFLDENKRRKQMALQRQAECEFYGIKESDPQELVAARVRNQIMGTDVATNPRLQFMDGQYSSGA